MFVISVNYLTDDLEQIKALRARHYEYLSPWFDRGVFLLGARRVPPTGGIILADGTDRAQLESIFADEPYAVAGLAKIDIVEIMPTKVHDRLANVIATVPA